jgi:hypothetical protein
MDFVIPRPPPGNPGGGGRGLNPGHAYQYERGEIVRSVISEGVKQRIK